MSRRILISGASVAGNTAAWWLARRGFDVDVVEKAPAFRDGGQNVDVRGIAREVLRLMQLEQPALERTTGELGTDWVDEDDRVIARFPVTDGDQGMTGELEILRGDISRLIYDSTEARANYIFGDSIADIEQGTKEATVTFASGRRERYDFVIVAEGVGSPTREKLFPGENRPRWLDVTIGYFSIPREAGDGDFARQYNTVGGRGAALKPSRDNRLGAYMGIQKKPGGENEWSTERQKQFFREQFGNDGWHFPRLLEIMSNTDDFYFDVLRQVQMDRWSDARVVLTGDAAWCATPLSGIGTTLAIVGAYVLVGELAATEDHAAAFASYERIMRPFVKQGQGIPKIVPRLLWPHTRIGLALMRGTMRLAAKPAIRKVISQSFARDANAIELPRYKRIAAA